MAGKTILVGY